MMIDNILWFILGTGVLFVIIFLWFVIYFWLNPQIENPDGKARITGTCGDTMEICLKFEKDHVVDTSKWTNGCSHSLNCISAAADLARGKTPDEIINISADIIRESVGGLPEDQMHCAKLAEETLQTALDNYMINRRNRSCSECASPVKNGCVI